MLDEAIHQAYEQVPRRQWAAVKVIVTQSNVTVLEHAVKATHYFIIHIYNLN